MIMTKRDKVPHVPQNAVEKSIRMCLERGKLADLLFDQGAGRGHRFLNQAIRSISKLPPVDKLIASKQLHSRFVSFVLKNVKDPTG